ncbi:MAG TPA: hypothetical protein VM889_08950 [Candidatus Thermoplasmatota archaeon]|nr:hypothetical protein [Candidatus Thermoplasmatota archaeon]
MPKPDKLDAPAEPEDAEFTELKSKISDSEKRYRKVLDTRDALNDQAREAREERDQLNNQKKSILDEMRKLQAERDALNAEARTHREKRNEFQRQAKELIAQKQKLRKSGQGSTYAGRVRELEAEIRKAEHRQETTAMTVAEENKLLDVLKARKKELEAARAQYAEETALLADVKDVDEKISQLFAAADEAHKLAVEVSNRAQAAHDALAPIFKQLDFLNEESDKKHQAYLKLREEADANHKEALEMRGEVMTLRDQRSAVFRERKALVTDQRKKVREALYDDDKLEAEADAALKALLSGGKVKLG